MFTYNGKQYAKALLNWNGHDPILFELPKGEKMIYEFAMPEILKIEFHNKVATVIYWDDDTVTRVVARNGDKFSPMMGLCQAIAKKYAGNYTTLEDILKYYAFYYINQQRVPNYDEPKKTRKKSTKKAVKKTAKK